MPRTCTLCTHPDRAAIDAALLRGEACAQIARDIAVSADAVERHRRAHLSAAIAKVRESAEVAGGDGLLANVRALSRRAESLCGEAERILRRALRERDHDTALEAIRTATTTMREARGALELLVKVYVAAGQVMTREEADLLRDQIFDVVMRHVPEPDRKAAIAADLQALRVRSSSREVPS